MLFRRIEAEGIAHYSYLIGDGGEAVVIDPRIDCCVYVEEAHLQGHRLTHILETHRHEDFVLGSAALAAQSGAAIWHGTASNASEMASAPSGYEKPLGSFSFFAVGMRCISS